MVHSDLCLCLDLIRRAMFRLNFIEERPITDQYWEISDDEEDSLGNAKEFSEGNDSRSSWSLLFQQEKTRKGRGTCDVRIEIPTENLRNVSGKAETDVKEVARGLPQVMGESESCEVRAALDLWGPGPISVGRTQNMAETRQQLPFRFPRDFEFGTAACDIGQRN